MAGTSPFDGVRDGTAAWVCLARRLARGTTEPRTAPNGAVFVSESSARSGRDVGGSSEENFRREGPGFWRGWLWYEALAGWRCLWREAYDRSEPARVVWPIRATCWSERE